MNSWSILSSQSFGDDSDELLLLLIICRLLLDVLDHVFFELTDDDDALAHPTNEELSPSLLNPFVDIEAVDFVLAAPRWMMLIAANTSIGGRYSF